MTERVIYLDYNASSPVLPEAKQGFDKSISLYGNPSSIHNSGRLARNIIERSRMDIATRLRSNPEEIMFTSGGTESNNTVFMVIKKMFKSISKPHILVSAIEHPSVREPAKSLLEEGWDVEWIPVTRDGIVNLNDLNSLIRDETIFISVQWVNNETGVIQPVDEISQIAQEKKILFHTDAVQSGGKLSLDLNKTRVDFLTMSAHKFGGVKGTGLLYVRQGILIEPIILGGAQEWNRRAGTENVHGIVAMASAFSWYDSHRNEIDKQHREFSSILLDGLKDFSPILNGSHNKRLSSTLNIIFPGIIGHELVMIMDTENVQISSGSACASVRVEPSPVLLAMGRTVDEAQHSVRISMGHSTDIDDIKTALIRFKVVLNRLLKG